MKNTILFPLFCCLCLIKAEAQFTKLVWSDEFDYTGLPDTTRWGYDVGNNNGWGNKERQFYTNKRPQNARVANGSLIIEARKEEYRGCDYTSSRLVTKTRGEWRYGRIEVRAKLPAGRGVWPALWLLPVASPYGPWPLCGEIDIMENVGYVSDTIYSSIHTGTYNYNNHTQRTKGCFVDDPTHKFHIYAMEWKEDLIKFFVDNIFIYSFINDRTGPESWPFDQTFYLILNIAVGGNWGGKFGIDNSVFPQKLEVDYVRIYQ